VPAPPPVSRRPPVIGLPPSSHRRTLVWLPLHLATPEGRGGAPPARRAIGAGRGAARPDARQGRRRRRPARREATGEAVRRRPDLSQGRDGAPPSRVSRYGRAQPARCEVRAGRGAAGEAGAVRGGVGARQQAERAAVARTRGRGGDVRRRREPAGRTGCTCPRVPIANRGGTLVGKKRKFLGLFVKYNLVGPDR
jgi:hypothetical protein